MWKVLGGSVAGRTHLARSLPCQDASGWHVYGEWACLAVADGAGSREHSDVGARAAVAAVLEWAASLAGEPQLEGLRDAFEAARTALQESATLAGSQADELACTLAVAVVSDGALLLGQVGDTLAFVRDSQGDTHTIAPPDRAEHINETTFLTSEQWPDTLRLAALNDTSVDSIALATDGLQLKILADVLDSTPYLPFFEDVFAWASSDAGETEGLLAFIEQLDDQTGDDKSLLLAVKDQTQRT
jgi:hypothetical protein